MKDVLASAILDAFEFDADHLYDFSYRDQRGRSRVYYHPYCDEGPFTTEILVQETELPVKGVMRFTFDYGDNWQFNVRLESVESDSRVLGNPIIIDAAGKAPEQYPRSDYD